MYMYFPTSPAMGKDVTQGQFFDGVKLGLSPEFSISQIDCFTQVKGPSLQYYLLTCGWGKERLWWSNG